MKYMVTARYSHEQCSHIESYHRTIEGASRAADKWTRDNQCDGGVLLAHVYELTDADDPHAELMDDDKYYRAVNFFDTHRVTAQDGGLGYTQDVSSYLSRIGKKGGSQTSARKKQTSAENGKKGGRPRKQQTE